MAEISLKGWGNETGLSALITEERNLIFHVSIVAKISTMST